VRNAAVTVLDETTWILRGKRDALGIKISACARRADILEHIRSASASRLFCRTPQLIAALHKIRDSYNVNGLGQVALWRRWAITVLPREFQKDHRYARMVEPELTKLGFSRFSESDKFHSGATAAMAAQRVAARIASAKNSRRWFHFLK